MLGVTDLRSYANPILAKKSINAVVKFTFFNWTTSTARAQSSVSASPSNNTPVCLDVSGLVPSTVSKLSDIEISRASTRFKHVAVVSGTLLLYLGTIEFICSSIIALFVDELIIC
uniref:Uncharacterized protein n=1 Tax=Glossina pallidipes TaxID=7398 RepID=A0A1A9Z241_GLOPL